MITQDKFVYLVQCGENLTTAFLGESEKRIYDDALAEAIVCMANAEGGYIFVGVEEDGEITGIHESRGFFLDVDQIVDALKACIVPELKIDIQPVEYDELIVLAIKVPKAARIVGTDDGVYKKRRIGEGNKPICTAYLPEEMAKDLAGREQTDYTSQKLETLVKNDLDELELERIFSMIKGNPESDHFILDMPRILALKQLGILKEHGNTLVPTVAGLLIAGEKEVLNKHVPTHEIIFECFEENGESVREVIKEPILRAFEKIWDFFDARNDSEANDNGNYREQIPDYDKNAFQEAVINAVVHRDYSIDGPIYIQWYNDKFDIKSPGPFSEGLKWENVLNATPTMRNFLLASVLKHLGIVHWKGRGVDTIFCGQLKYGRILPDYHKSNAANVVLSFYRERASLEVYKFWEKHIAAGLQSPGALHHLVFEMVYRNGKHELKEIAEILQREVDELTHVIKDLINWNYLTEAGDAEYKFTDEVCLFLESTATGVEEENIVVEKLSTQKTTQQLPVVPMKKSMNKARKYLLNATRKREDQILKILRDAPTTGRKQMAEILGNITEDGVKYHLNKMKKYGILTRVGPDKGGYWQINEKAE